MTALSKAHHTHRITDAIHAMIAAYPGKDDVWIITEVADEHGWQLGDVRAVFDDRFAVKGA